MNTIQNIQGAGIQSVQQYDGEIPAGARTSRLDITVTFSQSPPGGRMTVDTVDISFRSLNGEAGQPVPPKLYNSKGEAEYYDERLTRMTEQLIQSNDHNGDNALTSDELPIPGEDFKMADKNKDGKLNIEELNEEFQRLDQNRDLVVDQWEFRAGSIHPSYIEYKNNRFTTLW